MFDKDFSFCNKRKCNSLNLYKECITKYYETFDRAKGFDKGFHIFLDTNILLRYYSVSFTARKKLLDFLKKKKNQIVISSQVQLEFIKNRENVINTFFERVTNQVPSTLKSEVVNRMQSFIDNHKVVLKDYPEVEKNITSQLTDLEILLENLNSKTKQAKETNSTLIYKDEFLDFISSCNTLQVLEDEELKQIESDYKELCKEISDSSKIRNHIENNPNDIFPGIGDIKEKGDSSSGDFIIYHEIMKYMKDKTCDVIFLTFDSTKGDWMKYDKTPYIHYILNTYSNTNKLLYILDADRILKEILDVNIDSLLPSEVIEESLTTKTLLSKGFLNNLLQTHVYNIIEK